MLKILEAFFLHSLEARTWLGWSWINLNQANDLCLLCVTEWRHSATKLKENYLICQPCGSQLVSKMGLCTKIVDIFNIFSSSRLAIISTSSSHDQSPRKLCSIGGIDPYQPFILIHTGPYYQTWEKWILDPKTHFPAFWGFFKICGKTTLAILHLALLWNSIVIAYEIINKCSSNLIGV